MFDTLDEKQNKCFSYTCGSRVFFETLTARTYSKAVCIIGFFHDCEKIKPFYLNRPATNASFILTVSVVSRDAHESDEVFSKRTKTVIIMTACNMVIGNTTVGKDILDIREVSESKNVFFIPRAHKKQVR